MPANHEVTISDLYTLMMVVRDDVTKMTSSTESVRRDIDDHETRIRVLDREVKDSEARHRMNKEKIDTLTKDILESETHIEELKRRIYQYSGAAAVAGVLATPLINSIIGK